MSAEPMTSRERLWAALNGQVPDRVPIWMLFPRELYGSYVDVYNLPSYAPIVPLIRQTDWLDRRNIPAPAYYTAACQVESWTEIRDGYAVTHSVLHTPLGDLTATHKQDSENAAGARVEHY